MTFAPKCPNKKYFPQFFFWGGARAPLPPSPMPMQNSLSTLCTKFMKYYFTSLAYPGGQSNHGPFTVLASIKVTQSEESMAKPIFRL